MWHYLYETATGRLLSEAEADVAPTTVAGVTVLSRAARAADTEMWDPATFAFVARPAKVLVDRLDDLNNDPDLAAVWTRLTVAQRTALRNRLVRLLGYRRYRGSGEPVDLGDRP